jgi:hypothetical protein
MLEAKLTARSVPRCNLLSHRRPQAVDKDCAEDGGKIYRNCKYMTTIIAGSPGDQELTAFGMCEGDEGEVNTRQRVWPF